jgi:uncharacterized protein YndB with AHSA1/START domain
VVRRTPVEAFEIFTGRFGTWWPRDRFSIHLSASAGCGIEPRIGGAVFEIAGDGAREVWGTVIAWDPPRRFVMTWHPGRAASTAQEVEVRFVAVPGGTRVELEHRGWAKLGAEAAATRTSYDNGWAVVFDRCYAEACS